MGQRSQIYVRFNREDDSKILIARYFQWNYGTRMVSRGRYTLEWLTSTISELNLRYLFSEMYIAGRRSCEFLEKLKRIIEINFDYKDVVISRDCIREFFEDNESEDLWNSENFNDWVIKGQDNNDGQLLIDCILDYENKKVKFKYAFVDCTHKKIMDAIEYMDWDDEDWRTSEWIKKELKYTERNAKYISKHAKLMTMDEVIDFINYDYISDLNPKDYIDQTTII